MPRHLLIATAILFALAAGLSLYLWQLRRKEASGTTPVPLSVHPAPPEAGPAEKVTIWVAYDDLGTLQAETVSVPMSSGRQERAEQLLRSLVDIYTAKDSPHPLPSGAEVNAVYLVEPDTAVIDVNGALASGQVSGILAEDLTIASMIETLSANTPGLLRVKILVDGQERNTLAGHADISSFYDVSQVNDLAKELASE